LDDHFSIESRSFNGSAMKKSASPLSNRKIISLGTGRPTPDHYPWDLLSFQGSFPDQRKAMTQTGTVPNGVNKCETQKPVSQEVTKSGEGYNLALALNYGHAAGSPHLLRFVTEHIELVHDPPYADWGTCLTAGTTSALEIAFRMFCNKGDTILTEVYTYPGTLEVTKLVGLQTQGVNLDAEGASKADLLQILSTWDASRGPKPTVFYTIPSGHNPTGATQSLQRRREIYKIAEEHDLIILEDDPYYFLRLGTRPEQINNNHPGASLPSYLSLDKSGRVVRLDSASKILAPGLRAGWVTAQASILDKFLAYHEVSTVAVSGPVQIMMWKLLDES
jgi:aromatic amino acid aminotransferase I